LLTVIAEDVDCGPGRWCGACRSRLR